MTRPWGDLEARLAAVSGGDAALDARAHYDGWADSYDGDLDRYGYVAHQLAVDALAATGLPAGAAIVDVGCGTGLVGAALAGRGYAVVHGIDVSLRMLARARATGAYRQLVCADVGGGFGGGFGGRPPGRRPHGYDGLVSVGAVGPGHLGPTHVPSLVRLVKPGAPLVVYTNAACMQDARYGQMFDELHRSGAWTIVRTETSNYMTNLERPGILVVARRGLAGP